MEIIWASDPPLYTNYPAFKVKVRRQWICEYCGYPVEAYTYAWQVPTYERYIHYHLWCMEVDGRIEGKDDEPNWYV